MNKSAKEWLFVMLIPFFVGVIVLFLVPLEITISVNPKLEGIFNGFKIEVEQSTVRALAFLNGRVLTNRLQIYENLRSTFTRMLFLNDISQNLTVNTNQNLHNARNWDVLTSNATNLNCSMWYSPYAETLDMVKNNTSLEQIYNSYIRSEPFINSIMKSSYEVFHPITSIETTMFHNNEFIYFQYPSEYNQIFKNNSEEVLARGFSKTMENKLNQNFSLTILNNGSCIKLCSFVNWNVTNEPLSGTLCMVLSMREMIRDLTSELASAEFELSSNSYFLLRPLYESENLNEPQIVANFTSNNFSIVNVSANEYFDLTLNPLKKSLFESENFTNYQLNVQRHEKTNTYYTIPIMLYVDNEPNAEVGLYLVVLNNFAKAQLSEESTSARIQLIMITPSVLVFAASIVILILVMRAIMRELGQALNLMREYCSLIKRGDLELEIEEYNKTKDLSDIFAELDVINQLNKYSDSNYFKVSKPERIIRLLKCLKLCEKLGYDKTNLYENISSCYLELRDYENSIKFLKLSIDLTIKELFGNEKQIDVHYQAKLENQTRNHRTKRKKEKVLKRKILNLCKILYEANEIQNNQDNREISRLAEMLRKISYPDILNEEYISCLFFILSCQMKNGDFDGMEDKMEILYELIQGYEEFINQESESSIEVPPEIFQASWWALMGFFKMKEGKLPLAFKYFTKSLQTNRFDPNLHSAIHVQMEIIMGFYGMPKEELKSMRYMEQYKPRTEREYVFMIDVGKPPKMSLSEINYWKKSARRMAEHIFNRHILATDRISITEFCLDIKVICNLIEKGNREHLLKKEMLSSIKARDQTIDALLTKCLKKSIERIKGLKKEKVFIIFYKGGKDVNQSVLCNEVESVDNSTFLLFSQSESIIEKRNEGFHFIDFEDILSVNRILDEKIFKAADNIVSIL